VGPTGPAGTSDFTSIASHVLPSSDLTYDLGSTSSQWRSLYVGTGTIYIGGVPITVDTATNKLLVGVESGSTSTTATNLATEAFVINYLGENSGGSGISSSYSGIFTITNATVSASTITGALQVAGGVGIGGDLYVGGDTSKFGSGQTQLTINNLGGWPSLGGSNGVALYANNQQAVVYTNQIATHQFRLNVNNSTATSSTTTGALTVAGGVGIAGDLFVGGGIFGYAPLNSPIFEGTVQMESATFTGTVTMQQSVQKFVNPGIVAGAVALNFNEAAISVITPDNSNFTADIYNLPTTNNRTISISLILVQGATAYIPNAVLINGSGQTILWQGGVTPTGNANKRDIVSFTLLRKDSAWTVLGSLTSYG
jgi:hypothetical protein